MAFVSTMTRSFAKAAKKGKGDQIGLVTVSDFWFQDLITVWDRHTILTDREFGTRVAWESNLPAREKQLRENFEKELDNEDLYFVNTLDNIILFSQLPRMFYPNTAKALEYDDFALEMSKFLLPGVKKMPCFEALFVLQPLMQSEDMMDVSQCVRELEAIRDHVKSRGLRHSGNLIDKNVERAKMHQAIVNRFDRYP